MEKGAAITALPQTQNARQCVFSPCRSYRYTLWREWPVFLFDSKPGYAMFVGLNPSTADETKDDPTIRRCKAFAASWGYGALCMTNLFAWRDTKPENMKKAADPIGPMNDYYLFTLARDAGIVIAAWGKHGAHLGRAAYFQSLTSEAGFDLYALRINDDGSPEHPLYVPGNTKPRLLCGNVTESDRASGVSAKPRDAVGEQEEDLGEKEAV